MSLLCFWHLFKSKAIGWNFISCFFNKILITRLSANGEESCNENFILFFTGGTLLLRHVVQNYSALDTSASFSK